MKTKILAQIKAQMENAQRRGDFAAAFRLWKTAVAVMNAETDSQLVAAL